MPSQHLPKSSVECFKTTTTSTARTDRLIKRYIHKINNELFDDNDDKQRLGTGIIEVPDGQKLSNSIACEHCMFQLLLLNLMKLYLCKEIKKCIFSYIFAGTTDNDVVDDIAIADTDIHTEESGSEEQSSKDMINKNEDKCCTSDKCKYG